MQISFEDLQRYVQAVAFAAHANAVSGMEGDFLLYWDNCGLCRAFSIETSNIHLAINSLNGERKHYSQIVRIPLV